jgi:hypothetical protein
MQLSAVGILLLLAIFVHPGFTLLGYLSLLAGIKYRVSKLKDSQPSLKVTTAMLTLCIITSVLATVGSLNYLTYSAYASKILAIPFSFLLYQHH